MRASLSVVAALAVLSIATLASAQSVQVSADTREIYAGLPFAISVAASGFDEDPEPEAPTLVIDNADVVFAGSSPQVSRSLSIVNGRRTESVEVTFVFRYQVTPKKAGTYRIKSLEVVQGSKHASSQPATFNAKSVPRTDKMALRVELPDRPVWLGETFEATVDWYLASDPSRPGFHIPLFQSEWVSVRPPEGGGRRRQTVAFNARDQELEIAYESDKATLDGTAFTRLRFRALVTPSRAGTLELEPARVISGLEIGRTRDRFGFPVARTEVFEAVDVARKLEIRALPQSGRPATFKNAVGAGFSINVSASRTVVSVGDPIELEVTVKSDSRLDGMALPDLDKLLPPEHFGVTGDEPVGRVAEDGKTKVFLVTAQIKSKDVREVPRLELAYFNPAGGSYEIARSEPIALQVAGSALVGSAQVTSAATSERPGSGDLAVSLVGADLALSSPDDTLSAPLEVGSITPVLILLYVAPVLLVGFLVWRRRTSSAREDRSAVRALRRKVDDALSSAKSGPAKEAAAELASALRALARDVGRSTSDYESLIADLDAEAYNPRGGDTPLASSLLERSEAVAAALDERAAGNGSSATAAVVLLAISIGAASSVEASSDALAKARSAYSEALAIEDVEARRHAFANAAASFGEVVAQHPDRPGLLGDWGNASLGARQTGWAVLAYRRALHFDRGEGRARRNLTWVRSRLPEWAPTPDDSSAMASLLFWHRRYSVAARHLGAAFAFAGAIILLFAFRRRRAAVTAIGAGLAVAFVALLASALLEADRSRDAVVVRDAETLRAADSTGAPAVLSRPIPAGLEVEVIESRERWDQVELADGQRGWLPRSATRRVVP